MNELEAMERLSVKVEVEAVHCHGLHYLSEVYLVRRPVCVYALLMSECVVLREALVLLRVCVNVQVVVRLCQCLCLKQLMCVLYVCLQLEKLLSNSYF